MANQIEKLNSIAISDIEKINDLITTSVQALNGLEISLIGTAWSVTTALSSSRDRRGTGGAGNNSDFVLMGGYRDSASYVAYTDEWNGSSWSSQSNMPGSYLEGWYAAGRFGRTSNDAGSCGGYRSTNSQQTREYNGSSWSSTGNLSGSRQSNPATGASTNAALTFGGYHYGTGSLSSTEEYNGSSWSSGGSTPYTHQAGGAMGSQTDALQVAGYNAGSNAQTCSEYDGTSWSTTASVLMAAGQDPQAFGHATTTAHATGTDAAQSDHNTFDGTSWSTAGSHVVGRYQGGGGGTSSGAFVAAGNTSGVGSTNTCEEWT